MQTTLLFNFSSDYNELKLILERDISYALQWYNSNDLVVNTNKKF